MADPRGLLLALSLFGHVGSTTAPFAGVLSRGATDHYSLSFTINGIDAQVPLASFVPVETTLAENSSTPVTVRFPARTSGSLITFGHDGRSYLDLWVTTSSPPSSLPGDDGTVDLINATVAGFTVDFDAVTNDPVVFLDSGAAYSILDIRGVYVQPTSYIGDGNGPAGFYPNMLNGTVTSNVLVFREAVYDVRL